MMPDPARARVPGRNFSLEKSIIAVALLFSQTSLRCPSKPNPEISVTAEGLNCFKISAASLFSELMEAIAISIFSFDTSSFLIPDASTPVPSAFVSIIRSPAETPEFFEIMEGPMGIADCHLDSSCSQIECCSIKDPINKLNNSVKSLFDNMTLAEITS